jgi:hypothetical protein
MFSKSKKIDLSFLQYLTDEDISKPPHTIEQIKRKYPFCAKSNLESFKLFLILNKDTLSDDEKSEVVKTIKYLQEVEEEKYKLAFKYIEECQQSQQKSSQD